MVKVCLEEFPVGSYAQQDGPGYYMDGLLRQNIDTLAKNITDDQQFVGLVTGNGTVRNGKSTIAQQVGKYYSYQVGKMNKKKILFTCDNIVFNADDLIEKAFKVPKHSCIILDEGDDLTEHHFSKLTRKLRKFFRKCGQLNLFIILILPDFFEFPKKYALSRSNFLINVKFYGEFRRGVYDFFGPKNKKYLYFKGKKYEDYDCQAPNFSGRFVSLYTIDAKIYKAMKLEDAQRSEEEEVTTFRAKQDLQISIIGRIGSHLPIETKEELAKILDMSKRNINKLILKNSEKMATPVLREQGNGTRI